MVRRAVAGLTLLVGLLLVALTAGAALGAATAWAAWTRAPALPTDAEAVSLAGRLLPGPAGQVTQRRGVVFDWVDTSGPAGPRLLLGADDYEPGFVRVVVPAAGPAAPLFGTATARLRSDGWDVLRSGSTGVTARTGGDHLVLTASSTPAGIAVTVRRFGPEWAGIAALAGFGVGALLGAALFARAVRRRARRTLLALAVPGVLALLPATGLTVVYLLMEARELAGGPGVVFPDAPWAAYFYRLVRPAALVGAVLLAAALLVTLVSGRVSRRARPEPAAPVPEPVAAEPDPARVVGEDEENADESPEDDLFVRHEHPVWRDRADFVINAALPGRFEQIWARQIADDEFEVCCVPFHLYGVALGDVVRTSPAGGLTYVVERVVAASGRQVFRVFFSDPLQPREEITTELSALGALIEHPTDDVLAIDARDGDHAARLEKYLRQAQLAGHLGFEPGRARSATG